MAKFAWSTVAALPSYSMLILSCFHHETPLYWQSIYTHIGSFILILHSSWTTSQCLTSALMGLNSCI